MAPGDSSRDQLDDVEGQPPIQCDACESALQSPERHRLSFLLLDQLTVPLIGCDDHLTAFSSVCGYTTAATADLLDHRPAGGIGCPSCHLAPHNPHQPLIPVKDGAIAVLACPEHQSAIIDRFHTGLDTQQQLTAQLNAP